MFGLRYSAPKYKYAVFPGLGIYVLKIYLQTLGSRGRVRNHEPKGETSKVPFKGAVWVPLKATMRCPALGYFFFQRVKCSLDKDLFESLVLRATAQLL